jgi:hypothetical protein
MKRIINEPVSVTAVNFRMVRGLEPYPRRIEYQGITYTFADGIRYIIKRGERTTRLFDMTDGSTKFRLRTDSDTPGWTLVAITC